MPTLIDPRTLAFQLYDVLGADALCARPRFADYSREAFDAVLESARGIATELYLTHQKANDTDEPRASRTARWSSPRASSRPSSPPPRQA